MTNRPEPFVELDWTPERARALGERVVALWADFLRTLPSLPVDPGLPASKVREAVVLEIPDEPLEEDELIDHMRVVVEHSLYTGHPGFMAYISGAGTVPGTVADLLAAGINANVGGWRLAPAATEIETALMKWFAARFGLPQTAGGMMTSGGALANFVALKAARDVRCGFNVRATGVRSGPELALYASEEVHVVTDRAADMLGLGTEAVRRVAVDGDHQIDVRALEAAIDRDRANGVRGLAVVGNAGTVATGAIDPLEQLADICKRNELWFHIDAAYGGPAVLADDLRPLFTGIERADSIAFDPHKWMYTPHSGGCVLVRDLETLAGAFAVDAAYIHQDLERVERGEDFAQLGPQFSRGFQAFKVWISLLAHGRTAYGRRISHDAELARYLADRVNERADFELMSPASLSICCFRYVPPDLGDDKDRDAYLDLLNERIMTEIQQGTRTYYSNAVLRGRFVLRACIVNFRTEAEHIDELLEITSAVGTRLDAELRNQREKSS